MLVQAAEAGDFALVYALIAAGVDVNSANEHGTTPLMAAAAHGHLRIVSFLLENGADFRARRLDSFDALALAVFYGHLDIVRELIARGASLKTDAGTPLSTWATIRGFHDIAHVLTSGETVRSAVTHSNERSSVPKALEVDKQTASVAAEYVPKPRYNFKRKLRKLVYGSSRAAAESTYVESTYVAKPRYRNKGKFQRLVKCVNYVTSDWRRLAGLALIVMFVCCLGIVALLNLFGSSNVSQAKAPATSAATPPASFNPQDDLQSNTQPQPVQTSIGTSDASAGQSLLADKQSDDRSAPQVDNTERSSRLPDVEPLRKSSEKVDGLGSKATMTSKQETKGNGESLSGPKESLSGLAKRPPDTKTQRMRRVTERNDQLAPAATAGRNTKGKVIQWP